MSTAPARARRARRAVCPAGGRRPLPPYVPAAFVAIEDRRFYEHEGFDPMGIARAIITDLGQGRAAQGASTITQQLARNLFLTNDRTMERKAQELIYAVELEQAYSKQQILGLYLSRVYFGSGAYGIEAAAQRYFNKPAARLTIARGGDAGGGDEVADRVHPGRAAGALGRAHARWCWTPWSRPAPSPPAQRGRALAQSPKVWQRAADRAGAVFRRLGGRPDPRQLVARAAARTWWWTPPWMCRPERRRRRGATAVVARYARQGVGQAALVALDGDGRVRAMIGGVDYGASAVRPRGRRPSPGRLVRGSRSSIWRRWRRAARRTPGGRRAGDDRRLVAAQFRAGVSGPITLERALAQSINTVAARLADEVGRGGGGRRRAPAGHRLADQHRSGHGAGHHPGDAAGDGAGL